MILMVLVLLLVGLSGAQSLPMDAFRQEGIATQELPPGAFTAHHPSRPIGSGVIVRNTENGREVEVTITGRIPASRDRIIDLSPTAAEAIGLEPGVPVLLYTPQPVASFTVPVPQSEPFTFYVPPAAPPQPPAYEYEYEPITSWYEPPPFESEPPRETARESEPREPINITMHIYLSNQDKPAEAPRPEPQPAPPVNVIIVKDEKEAPPEYLQERTGTTAPELNWLAWLSYMTSLAQTQQPPASEEAPPQAQLPPPQQPLQPPLQEPLPQEPLPQMQPQQPPLPQAQIVQPQSNSILIIPAMPDPEDGKLYRMQLGAYGTLETASRIVQELRSAGFDAVCEQTGTNYRVLTVGIPSSMAYHAVQRLGALGFREIWIKE